MEESLIEMKRRCHAYRTTSKRNADRAALYAGYNECSTKKRGNCSTPHNL